MNLIRSLRNLEGLPVEGRERLFLQEGGKILLVAKSQLASFLVWLALVDPVYWMFVYFIFHSDAYICHDTG